ncbi:MAG: hypothetical protein Q9170_004336 [Blastenia crenularia]
MKSRDGERRPDGAGFAANDAPLFRCAGATEKTDDYVPGTLLLARIWRKPEWWTAKKSYAELCDVDTLVGVG